MFATLYEEFVNFVAEPHYTPLLQQAQLEYFERTGELLEDDATFEIRMNAFLEWFIFDRILPEHQKTPAQLYAAKVVSATKTLHDERIQDFTRTQISIFDFRCIRKNNVEIIDLLHNKKHYVFERRNPIAMNKGDIFVARLVPYDDKLLFSQALSFVPQEGRNTVIAACKKQRLLWAKATEPVTNQVKLDFIHRLVFLINRAERYKHVSAKQIFSEF